jgi:hypothetical protein
MNIHLQAVPDGESVRVMLGSEIIVVSDSTHYVADGIKALKMLGHDHATYVEFHSVSGNPAFKGAIHQHRAS